MVDYMSSIRCHLLVKATSFSRYPPFRSPVPGSSSISIDVDPPPHVIAIRCHCVMRVRHVVIISIIACASLGHFKNPPTTLNWATHVVPISIGTCGLRCGEVGGGEVPRLVASSGVAWGGDLWRRPATSAAMRVLRGRWCGAGGIVNYCPPQLPKTFRTMPTWGRDAPSDDAWSHGLGHNVVPVTGTSAYNWLAHCFCCRGCTFTLTCFHVLWPFNYCSRLVLSLWPL